MIENPLFIIRIPNFTFRILNECLQDLTLIKKILSLPFFQEALFIASPLLYEELHKYIKGNLNEKEQLRIENTIIRYLERACTRSTPFGLFASIAIGKLDNMTGLIISESTERKVRIDMFLLCRIVQFLVEKSALKYKLIFYKNSTLYEVNGSYRCIEYYYLHEQRKHRIINIKKDAILASILRMAEKGVTINDLKETLLARGYNDLEAVDYISSLIDSQILISELEPNLTGRMFFTRLLKKISEIDPQGEITKTLYSLSRMIQSVEANCHVDNILIYNQIYNLINSKLIQCDKSLFLQVDSFKQMKIASISYNLIEKIKKMLIFLNKLSTKMVINSDLELFKTRFIERYQDREVNLLEVLDPDIGLGYPVNKVNIDSELLNLFHFPIKQSIEKKHYQLFEKIILEKILDKKIDEIDLEDVDVSNFEENWTSFPPTFSVKFELVDADTIIFDNASGMSAGNLIARFSHCHIHIEKQLKEIASMESSFYKGKIVAEIVHLPESRVGNILARSSFRDYELIYLAGYDNELAHQINLSDVFVSVKNNKVCLKSKNLNKEIIPRLTTAHNYHYNSTPVYRFLCDIQSQSMCSTLTFSWSTFENKLDYFPRIKYGNIILSPACWRIKVAELKEIMRNNRAEAILKKIAAFRIKKNIPQKVYLVDGDNTLYVDFESFLSIRAFYDIIEKRSEITLKEFIAPVTKAAVLRDSKGNPYLNEIIMLFKNEKFVDI